MNHICPMRYFMLFSMMFMLNACCAQVNIPEALPVRLQGSLWKMVISRNGQGVFEGLMALGTEHEAGMEILACSIIDSTGITLMKLAGEGGRLHIKTVLPPFDEKSISDYIISELGLFLSYSCGKDEYAGQGMCLVREYHCEEESMDSKFIKRCISAHAGPFIKWRFQGLLGPGPQDAENTGMVQAVITRPWSGMTMRLYRLK